MLYSSLGTSVPGIYKLVTTQASCCVFKVIRTNQQLCPAVISILCEGVFGGLSYSATFGWHLLVTVLAPVPVVISIGKLIKRINPICQWKSGADIGQYNFADKMTLFYQNIDTITQDCSMIYAPHLDASWLCNASDNDLIDSFVSYVGIL